MKNLFPKKAKIFSLTLAGLLAFFSCKDSFLEIPAAGSLSDAQLRSKAGVEGLLVAAYGVMLGRGLGDFYAGSTNWVGGSVQGGEANKGTDAGDQAQANFVQRYELIASSNIPNFKWRGTYEGISRCNSVLRILLTPPADMTPDDVKRVSAEARFMRGHYYFELQKTFNKVPYVDEKTEKPETIPNSGTVWAQIEADLKFAADNLPETQAAAGRANKWAAVVYHGKALLYQKKYTEALAQFNSAIANGKTASGKKYALEAKFGDVFNVETENGGEHIFSIQGAVNTGTINNAMPDFVLNFTYTSAAVGCCGFFQPSIEAMNSFRTNATTGLPLLDGSYNDAANAVKSDQGIDSKNAFTPDAGPLDPRIDWTAGRRGIPYLDWGAHPGKDWIRDQPDAGPYSPKKFMISKAQYNTYTDGSSWTRGYTALNYPVLRHADLLLMAAECEIELATGDLTKAWGYINQIRTRAANTAGFVMNGTTPAANYVIRNYPGTGDRATARTAMRMERKLELSQEGHIFYDLVRWGIAADYLNRYLAFESKILTARFGGAKFTAGVNEYWPIPQVQIDLHPAGVLTQNPGY
jgi:starch-binding outer membrane protein, SusD/RagB family